MNTNTESEVVLTFPSLNATSPAPPFLPHPSPHPLNIINLLWQKSFFIHFSVQQVQLKFWLSTSEMHSSKQSG